MDDSDRLEKIYIALPDDATFGGESLWALPLGDDLYEVRNIPFFTYDLHFLDVVRAIPPGHGMKPEVKEVVRRSGHKTLRVLFTEEMSDEGIAQIFGELNQAHAHYEKATSRFYIFDVEPDADYPAICTYLSEREQAGLLEYETGMTRQDDAIH